VGQGPNLGVPALFHSSITEFDNFQYTSLIFEGSGTFFVGNVNEKEAVGSDNTFVSYQIDIRGVSRGKKEHILELEFQGDGGAI
jgi:hypothetical protein